jgi:hypothetical protein
MRLKHNKKRNTAFVYEALVRELTESVVRNNKHKQNKIVSIIKEHFGKSSTLKKELDLYQSIYETRYIDKNLAEKIVVQVKQEHDSLDKKKLFQEQSALINKINRTLSNKVYNNFVPNYKSIATVYSIFQEELPVKDRVLLEENIINQMSASADNESTTEQKPIDSIVYRTFVDKFNHKYSSALNEQQQTLLNHYVSSFSDNELELKIYLNDEIGRLKSTLKECVTKKPRLLEDEVLKNKVESIYSILETFQEKSIDTDLLETVLRTQELVEELEKDGD